MKKVVQFVEKCVILLYICAEGDARKGFGTDPRAGIRLQDK